jgi:ketosteroid isomerase-like protein
LREKRQQLEIGILNEMPSQAADVARRTHEVFNSGDFEGFVESWDPDCEYRPALEGGVQGGGGVYRGHDGIRRWWRDMEEAWREWSTEIHEIRDLGHQRVLVLGVFRAQGRHTGIAFESPLAQVVETRAGKVVSSQDYFDQDAALEAVGPPD